MDMYALWTAFAILLLSIVVLILVHRSPQHNKTLPPGTMGWIPIIGETLEYAQKNCSLTAGPYINKRVQRYGKLFKSHLFGEPIIVSVDPKLNQFILQKEGTLFKSSYPQSLLNIIGKKNTTEIHGETHKAVRSAVLNVVGSRIRSDKNIYFISTQVLKKLDSWDGRVVKFQDEASHLSFSLVINQLLSLTPEHPEAEYIYENFEVLVDGLLRVPIDLPGTGYSRSIKARKNVIKVIKDIISEKTAKPCTEIVDVLDGVLAAEEESRRNVVTRDVVIDVMVGVIFAAYETTSSIFTFAAKFIMEHPDVLKALQEEHYGILENIEGDEKRLTWEHYKLMSFTENVVKETLRLANAGDVVFREVIEDVEVDGYTIPKGWKIMPSFIPAHLDPTNFPDPLAFNPWRWQVKSGEGCFTPFGGGPRQCAGKDLAKLEVSIFIHHLVTRYRWEQVEKDEVIRSRGARFSKGFPLYFKKLDGSHAAFRRVKG